MTIDRVTANPLKVAPIDDARVRFYLDYQQAIEEWAALRQDANAALHACLLDLGDQLAVDAQSVDDPDLDVRVDASTKGLSCIALTHRRWHDTTGNAPAAVVVEWPQQPIDASGALYLYVGVRVGERRRRDQRLHADLSALGPTLRQQLGRPWEREHGAFPVWRWIRNDEPKLDELAVLQETRTAVWQCWNVTAAHIDRLLSSAP